ncbi:hypothetical protein RF55_9440 [Lasius niger]|uniref:Peptidase aspartic putative domain-containing protein n=1 Tax=Lasius niger TaxID=67767 RepID=A0A0J7KJZ7_LASNI|nr:hypothetical protein RF55_9440 [Lasius niger]
MDTSTTQVEKLHYLKSCLKGEAELLVRNLSITDENFDRAWNVLTDYFENNRLLVRSYISKFTALQKLKANRRAWTHLSGLELADLDFLAADPVEILLGADVYATILQEGLRKGGPQEPVAQQTTLGWILSGAVNSTNNPRRTLAHLYCAEDDLTAIVRRFWQQEELLVAAAPLTPEDQKCEDFFLQTHSRTADGRYVVRLPVLKPLPDFSSTRFSALRVLTGMKRRFTRDARLHQLYLEFMRQYEDLDHMTPVGPA